MSRILLAVFLLLGLAGLSACGNGMLLDGDNGDCETPPPSEPEPSGIVFWGARCIATAGGTTVRLDWDAAVDGETASAAMTYRIYASSTAGGHTFAAPVLTTGAGATSATLTAANTGLIAVGQPVWFVVRAVDGDGNEDENIVSLGCVPTATSSVAYVDSLASGPGTVGSLVAPFPTVQSAVNAIVALGGGLVLVSASAGGTDYVEEVDVSGGHAWLEVHGGFPRFTSLSGTTTPAQLLALRDLVAYRTTLATQISTATDLDLVRVTNSPATLNGLRFANTEGTAADGQVAVRLVEAAVHLFCCDFADRTYVQTATQQGGPCALVANTSTCLRDESADRGRPWLEMADPSTLSSLRVQGNQTRNAAMFRTAAGGPAMMDAPGCSIVFTSNRGQSFASDYVRMELRTASPGSACDLDVLVEANEVRNGSGDVFRFTGLANVGVNGSATFLARKNLFVGFSSEGVEVECGDNTQYAGVDVRIEVLDNLLIGSNGSNIEVELGVSAGRTTRLDVLRNNLSNGESEAIEVDADASSTSDASDGGIIRARIAYNVNSGGEDLPDWRVEVPYGGLVDLLIDHNTQLSAEDPVSLDTAPFMGSTTVVRAYPVATEWWNVFNNDVRGGDDEAFELDDFSSRPDRALYFYFSQNTAAPSADSSDASIDLSLIQQDALVLFERCAAGWQGEDDDEGVELDIGGDVSLVRLRNFTGAQASGDGLKVANDGAVPDIRNVTFAFNGQDTQYGLESVSGRTTAVHNSIFAFNSGDLDPNDRHVLTYSLVRDGVPAYGWGNIAGEPLFAVSVDAFVTPSVVDFNGVVRELFWLSPRSPAVDAGDPDPIWNDRNGTRNDMGVFGGPWAGPVGALDGNPALPLAFLGIDRAVHLWTGASLPSASAPLVLVFNQDLDASTIAANVRVFSGGVQVPGSTALSRSGRGVTFTPSTVLNPGGSLAVEVRLATGLLSASGQPLQANETFRFAVAGAAGSETEANDDGDGAYDTEDLPFADLLGLAAGRGSARVAGNIDATSDVDVYSFSGVAGDRITATVLANRGTQGAFGSRETRILLLDSAGVELHDSDDRFRWSDSGNNADPLLDWMLPATGTYYLVVVDNAFLGAFPYELQVTRE